MIKLSITSRTKAGKLLLSSHSDITHVISIADFNGEGNRGKPPSGFFRSDIKKIFLQFDDVDDPSIDFGPTENDIKQIIEFGKILKENCQEVHLLTNCMAGICRSTAAAYIVLCIMLGENKEFEAIDMVFGSQPEAIPNILMVSIADKLLERKGAMTNALWIRQSSETPMYPAMR